MKRFGKRLSTAVLSVMMIFSALCSTAPMSVFAAPTTKDMAHLKAGSENGNAHFGGAKPEAFILSDKADIKHENFSFQLKLNSEKDETRFRFVNKYVDDTHWGYIAYDGAGNGNWFYEFKNGDTSGYPGFSGEGLPALHKGDIVNFTGTYEENRLVLTVENTTTGETKTAYAENTDFLGLKDQAGKIGFGAATYGSEYTDLYFADVKLGDHSYQSDDYGNWTLYRNIEGQIWEPKVNVTIKDEVETPSEEGKTWFQLTGGTKNGGGHSYGNPNAVAPILLLDQDKKMDNGTLSLSVKPSSNWGVFHTYVDDDNWLYVGYDASSKWYYQYKLNGETQYPGIGDLPTPVEGEALSMSITLNRETLSVSVNGVTKNVTNQKLIAFAQATNGKGHFGVKTNGATKISFSDVKYNEENCMDDSWEFAAQRPGQKFEKIQTKLVTVSGVITEEGTNTPIEGAKVMMGQNSVRTASDGSYQMEKVEANTYDMAVTKPGYQAYTKHVTLSETEENVFNVSLSKKEAIDLSKFDTIQSKDMIAYIGKDFPYVARYVRGDHFFRANEEGVDSVVINGVTIKPVVTIKSTSEDARVYTLNIKNEAAKLDFTMDVKLSIKENTLTWEVSELKKADGCVKIASIDIPQLSLLSVDAVDQNANFAGANTSLLTTSSGDSYIDFDHGFEPSKADGYLYGFLTNEHFSAGLFSNSEAEGDKRVVRRNGADTMSLTSAAWYYEAGDKGGQKVAANYADYPTSELPVVKVAIGDDLNDDNTIDWNDGALAFRKIMNIPYGSENIKDIVNYRIVMNFASMASNPYLTTADNIKKVYLATDGLPQAVMLKGYGNEGHDSANSEYADIAEREGGVEDFQELIRIAHQYGTEIGIHVNAQEAYPEAASFNEDMLSKPFGTGWGWLDQSFVIDKIWDLASQARWKRFVQLYDRINGTDFYSREWPNAVEDSKGEVKADKDEIKKDAESREDNMDFIYLDVWYQDAWETRQIAKEINSLGWRFSTEFSGQGEYDSTWQHWATDAPYGGASSKGFNSDIIRFIRNDQRDSQVLNYPSYGGTADNPLLGGYHLYGFEGWGGDKDFNNYIKQTFNENLPTKFLQHYYVTDWENYAEGESPTGNHEKQITLKNDDNDKVVVTRKEEQRKDDNIERTITLNGRKVLDDVTYLLPWTDEDGVEKLYHWNLDGGTTSWELPEDWKGHEIKMYELSDQGRIHETTLASSNGTVTIDAKAATAYVLSKGNETVELKNSFGESDYVADPGFNAYASGEQLSSAIWNGDINDSSVVVEKANTGDQRLAFNDPQKDVSVSTIISGLTPGTDYVAEVYVENNSDAKASITVNSGSKKVMNYTQRSILNNYVKSDQKNGSKMQRMQISFTAESTTAELILSREAAQGSSYMDDIRIVKKTLNNFQKDGSFTQDFESVVQGLYPFVLSSAQGISDPSTHLSQLHAPYTEAGWNGRVIDDTISGEWSLKHHSKNTGIIYQTLPQNYRFEPGKIYTVEFDYQSGPDKAYAMVVGNGTNYTAPKESDYLEQKRGEDGHVTMHLIGGENGQTWIGLYQNGGRTPEGKMGESDFVLDNLVIKEDTDTVFASISTDSLFKGETAQINGNKLDQITWTSSDESVAVVDTKEMKVKALKEGSAVITATLPDQSTMTFPLTITDKVITILSAEELGEVSMEANTEETIGESAGKENVFDGDPATIWHSGYTPSQFVVSEDHPAILTIDLGKEVAINGFQFQQRAQGGLNGLVHQFSYRILAEDKETILAEGTHIEVSEEQQGNGSIIPVVFTGKTRSASNKVNARFIEISVEKGHNNFAAIAEVQPILVQSVADTASIDDITLDINESKTMEIKHPENTMLKGIVWSSSDESIASVSQDGTVTGIAKGTAKIRIQNAAGLYAESSVTVTETIIVTTEALKEQIKAAEAIDLAAYADGIEKEAFLNALANAKAVLSKEATQEEVDQALDALKAAQDKLVKLDTEDKEAPSTPTDLKVDTIGTNHVEISWKASTDNKEVSGYAIYVNGEFLGSVTDTKVNIKQLQAGTAYTIEVKAFDQANNYSDAAKLQITTEKAEDGSTPDEGGNQPDETVKPDETIKPDESQDDKKEENKPVIEPVDTGDTTDAASLAFLMLISGGALIIGFKRRKRHKA